MAMRRFIRASLNASADGCQGQIRSQFACSGGIESPALFSRASFGAGPLLLRSCFGRERSTTEAPPKHHRRKSGTSPSAKLVDSLLLERKAVCPGRF
jgi:hypothetical protein